MTMMMTMTTISDMSNNDIEDLVVRIISESGSLDVVVAAFVASCMAIQDHQMSEDVGVDFDMIDKVMLDVTEKLGLEDLIDSLW
jgi:hypothetical protein